MSVSVLVCLSLICGLCNLPRVALAEDAVEEEMVDVTEVTETTDEGQPGEATTEEDFVEVEDTAQTEDQEINATTQSNEEIVPNPDISQRTDANFPSKFDLRDRGVVTPVKMQNPFGTCWAFAATAATETSILTKLSMTYAETGLDLSERYLSWYVARPVTENINKSQVGEGLNIYNTEAGPNHIHNFGGREECAATLYAQGIGPQLESDYPYNGTNHRLAYQDLLINKDAYIAFEMAALREFDHFASEDELRRDAELDYEFDLARYQKHDVYSPLDDWSITEPDEPGSGKLRGSPYTLTDNNVFDYWIRKGTGDMDSNERYEAEGNQPIVTWDESNLYQDSIDQIKAELYAGRGVAVDFSIDDNVLNGETWAVYNDHSLPVSRHAVCIVGWDDNYAASNFTHTRTPDGKVMINSSGREITDDRAREITTPVADGAWICKNSWGSETDAVPNGMVGPYNETKNLNEDEWGIVDENGKHTGYFYLSYFDYTIGVPESFDFDIRANNDQENALQFDYLPASAAEWRNNNTSPMWEANIFTLEKDMRLDEVATRIKMTGEAPLSGYDVTFDLYKLNKGAKRPDDGKHLATCTHTFEIQGYHRAPLDKPVFLKAGDRLGIVVQQSHTFADGTTKYCVSAQETIGYRENPRWRRDPLWGNPVVNEGESFWKAEGITDQEEGAVDGWLDITQPMGSTLNKYLNPETWYLWDGDPDYIGRPIYDFFSMDNFCIKAFGEPASLEHVEAVLNCENTGVVEHWRDPQTGITYADENGKTVLEDTTAAPLGHAWDEGTVTKEPTLRKTGTLTYTCTRCGAKRDETIPVASLKRAAKPSTKVHVSTGTIDAKWKAVSGAKKYEVAWRKAGGKWKSTMVKTTEATIEGLTAGKLYDVRVRAINGSLKGTWSKASHRWLRNASSVKVKAGRAEGSIKVGWKEDSKATAGFRVLVYAKKGGKIVATKLVANNKRSVTIKGLKSKKKYYVRVRPLRTRENITYVGSLCGYRSVEAK